MIISLQKRELFSRVILAFAISVGIIGIMDGGFFATPTIAGLYGLLIILLDEYVLDNLTKLDENEDSNATRKISPEEIGRINSSAKINNASKKYESDNYSSTKKKEIKKQQKKEETQNRVC